MNDPILDFLFGLISQATDSLGEGTLIFGPISLPNVFRYFIEQISMFLLTTIPNADERVQKTEDRSDQRI